VSLEQIREAQRGRGSLYAIPEVVASPLVQRLRTQQAEIAARQAGVGQSRLEANPAVVALRAEEREVRGRIDDEVALIDALRRGTIRAAGLDVFEREPLPADSELLSMPNVVALPHIGSATHETRLAMAQLAVDNLIAALDGKPQNVVNPAALSRARAA
jgi:hypothetical protein